MFNSAKTAGYISIAGNVLLFALKLWAGLISSSVALIADAWHTLSDSISSIILILGIKFSEKKPDKEHPFGHGRAELITMLIIGILLILVSVGFVKESIERFIEHKPAHYGPVAIWVTVVSILIKEAMAQYSIIVAKKVNSGALKADGWHHRSDAISSVVILVGILFANKIWWIDAALGIVVAGLIMLVGYNIIMNAVNPLLGEEIDKKTVAEIKKMSKDYFPFTVRPHHFHVHNYGNHIEMTFHIKMPGEMTIQESHDMITAYETAIYKKFQIVPTIHVDPALKNEH